MGGVRPGRYTKELQSVNSNNLSKSAAYSQLAIPHKRVMVGGGKMSSRNIKDLFVFVGEKAGMIEDVDEMKRQREIIKKVSEGSAYYNHQVQNSEVTEKKILELREKKSKLTERQLEEGRNLWEKIAQSLEQKRDINRVCVVIDMDAFYVSCELVDKPDLQDKPVAVGGGVITTANYVARKFGVRSAMPTFMARQLCPSLIVIPTNFEKYVEESKKVHKLIAKVDPSFRALSLDEVNSYTFNSQ